MRNATPVLPFTTRRPTRRHYFLRVNFWPFSFFTRTTYAKINPGYNSSYCSSYWHGIADVKIKHIIQLYRSKTEHMGLVTKMIRLWSGRFFCLTFCMPVCSLTQNVMHGHTWYFSPNVGLGPVSMWFHFGGDLDWPSLSFRGHSRPARSTWHKINCSTETLRDTAKVTIEH